MSVLSGSADGPDTINVQVYVPDFQIQKCLHVHLDQLVWDVKQKIVGALPQDQPELFNYGLFLPPCNGRAGKFLLEERPLRDYPFHDCVPYLELKYKKRVYKMLAIDEKLLKQLHSKGSLKKFMEYVTRCQSDKVDKLLTQGLDPNFHDPQGETPLTLIAGMDVKEPEKLAGIMMQLVSGGAHLDYRNQEGQTALHKAVFCRELHNVKTLLELGASPNAKDPLGLTPLYYAMLRGDTNSDAVELLLRDFADVGTTDMHGNHELHQACKNALAKHVEHLLFYGADLNAQNVNGNTPLHVCAVNNTENCARLLLFRGASADVKNNAGQTAFNVAMLTGNQQIARLIREHDPAKAVPYRGSPTYNTKRRPAGRPSGSTMGRTRSFSQSSCASAASSHYAMAPPPQQPTRAAPMPPGASPSPCPSNGSPSASGSHYDTGSGRTSQRRQQQTLMRKSVSTLDHYASSRQQPQPNGLPPVAPLQAAAAVGEVNIARILVIPRSAKGFGFILRGAKRLEQGVRFEPTVAIPALQFFEGVDMNGMAMRAGLKPGDFLLEINGVDVRCANHDQVVELIQAAGDTISLKVITIDVSAMQNGTGAAAPASHYDTMPARKAMAQRARSAAAPPLPERHASTSLSTASGRRYSNLPPQQQQHCSEAVRFAENGGGNYAASGGLVRRRRPSCDSNSSSVFANEADRCASVRSRPSSRRISALELEQLMARQPAAAQMDDPGGHFGTMQPCESPSQQHRGSGTPHRKYTSVADMKRRRGAAGSHYRQPNGLPRTYTLTGEENELVLQSMPARQHPQQHDAGVKRMGGAFVSTPDLQSVAGDDQPIWQRQQDDVDGRLSGVLRPKTPPPPPPQPHSARMGDQTSPLCDIPPAPMCAAPPPPAPPPPSSSTPSTSSCPPPPPPPPSASELKGGGVGGFAAANKGDCRGVSADALRAVRLNKTRIERDSSAPVVGRVRDDSTPGNRTNSSNALRPSTENQNSINGGAGGITMEALNAVRLKPAANGKSQNGAAVVKFGLGDCQSEERAKNDGKPDFDSDLRQALARRRNKMNTEQSPLASNNPPAADGHQQQQNAASKPAAAANGPSLPPPAPPIKVAHRTGLSLKESVQQSIVHKQTTQNQGQNGNTVVNVGSGAFGNKKDSGYTSSRTSLEPSECGDETTSNGGSGHLSHVIECSDDAENDGINCAAAAGDQPSDSLAMALKRQRAANMDTQALLPPNVAAAAANEKQGVRQSESTADFPPPPPPEFLNAAMNGRSVNEDRVMVLSQQLEENLSSVHKPPPQLPKKPSLVLVGTAATGGNTGRQAADAVSVTSTLSTMSGMSCASTSQSAGGAMSQSDADSGISPMMHGNDAPVDDDRTPTLSCTDLSKIGGSNEFGGKPLRQWTVADVADWLDSLHLAEYKNNFVRANVTGSRLVGHDRALMTQLGVTRIAHRKTIEASLKRLGDNN